MNDPLETVVTPEWLMRAKLKARQLDTDADKGRNQYTAIQDEIFAVTKEQIQPLEQRRVPLTNQLDGFKGPDNLRKQLVTKIENLTAEIDMLNAHVDGARARQKAVAEENGPRGTLATDAQAVIRTLHGQATRGNMGSN